MTASASGFVDEDPPTSIRRERVHRPRLNFHPGRHDAVNSQNTKVSLSVQFRGNTVPAARPTYRRRTPRPCTRRLWTLRCRGLHHHRTCRKSFSLSPIHLRRRLTVDSDVLVHFLGPSSPKTASTCLFPSQLSPPTGQTAQRETERDAHELRSDVVSIHS